MESVPEEWRQRLDVKSWQESFLGAMEFDTVVLSKYLTETQDPMNIHRWVNPLINNPLGKPIRRLAGVEALEVSEKILSVIKTTTFCAVNPCSLLNQVQRSRSNWSFGDHLGFINYFRAWKNSMQSLVHLKLSRKILQVKKARNSAKSPDWPQQVEEMQSSLCPETKWLHHVAPDGTIQIYCNRLPEWVEKEHRNRDLPLTYSLAPAS